MLLMTLFDALATASVSLRISVLAHAQTQHSALSRYKHLHVWNRPDQKFWHYSALMLSMSMYFSRASRDSAFLLASSRSSNDDNHDSFLQRCTADVALRCPGKMASGTKRQPLSAAVLHSCTAALVLIRAAHVSWVLANLDSTYDSLCHLHAVHDFLMYWASPSTTTITFSSASFRLHHPDRTRP